MKSAHLYLPLGWRLLPLHSVRADGRCTCGHTETAPKVCECGNPTCSRHHGEGSIGKHPRLPDWATAASNDADQAAQWSARWPGSNVGVATGRGSGVIVLDVDTYKGGAESLAALEAKHGALPLTATSRTGGGGLQYFFQAGDTAITNSAGRLGTGLDFRAEGGQAVLPPSVSGRGAYTWIHTPWDVPPAPAPAWLLALLGRAAPASSAPTERGHFPAASPEVLAKAAEALAHHGPAIDGDGGGLHTVQAAAILTHDFALTEDEAWPLFEAWNRTCVTPWELEELRVRLARGLKYGKLPFGCRRELDVIQAFRKLVTDWENAGSDRDTLVQLAEAVRDLLKTCADPLHREIIERELHRATGLPVRALKTAKPAPAPIPLKQGEIRVCVDLGRVADEATAALAPMVFQRSGVLCEVVAAAERTWIQDLAVPRVVDFMSRTAAYVRQDENKGMVKQVPPEPVARIIHARRSHEGVRVLEAVTSAPVFLADGSILHERGYNEAARLFLEPSVSVVVPEHPTRDNAVAAVRLFQNLLSDFQFASPADFSAWLAALLSTLVKSATRNAPAPLFVVSAPSQGSGKSLLSKLIAQIVTGADAELRPYNPRDESEWGKRLTSYVKAGSPLAVFDNIDGGIGDPGLDALLTSSSWSDRQLGASEAPPLPNVTTWMATGNNLEPRGDTVRRSLVIRIETTSERPQDRGGWKLDLEGGYALDHRAALLGAALTMLRAYHLAGRPEQRLAPWWGGAWTKLVRGALVWAGCSDPYETQRRAQLELNEGEHEAHDFWLSTVGASDGSPAGIVLVADQRGAAATLGLREQLTPHRLRLLLARFVDKVRRGQRIRRTRNADGTRYRVESVPV